MPERLLTNANAFAEGLREEMRRDQSIFIIGEDVIAHEGLFREFKDIPAQFPDRIINTPVSETCVVGAGLGAALTGKRPLVVSHFIDFLTCAMDEIVNQAAKIRYMSGGQVKVPLVIWCADGGRLNAAAQHSQSLEAWFVHTPGIKVVVSSEPYDAKGLIKSSLRDDGPVMFIQHKKIFGFQAHVPEEEYLVPLGQAAVKRQGRDVTLVTYGIGCHLCLEAAQELSRQGIEAEVIDLRTLKPLDMETIAESIKKTNRAVVVHEACLTGGFGGEIVARMQLELFDYLDAPIVRVAGKDAPVPFSPPLEDRVLFSVAEVVEAARAVLYR